MKNDNYNFIPKNEMGVVHLFSLMQHRLGCRIVEIGSRFPDAKIEKDGRIYRVEFEYKASNFIQHGHDEDACDVIVCWENDFRQSPFPGVYIIALSLILKVHLPEIEDNERLLDSFYWMQRALDAENRNLDHIRSVGNVQKSETSETITYFDTNRDVIIHHCIDEDGECEIEEVN